MTKTNNFVKSMLAKGFVDEVEFLANGYNIVSGKDTIFVRTKGGDALIWNNKNPKLVQVKSGRLDDVLHRYIVLSCVGKTSGKTKLGNFEDVVFVPQSVVEGKVIFADAKGRNWIASKFSAKNVMSYFTGAQNVSAEDTMLMMDGFEAYDKGYKISSSTDFSDSEAEYRVIESNMNLDSYSVYPKSGAINKVGTTVVGNFLASCTDRINVELFENLEKEMNEKKTLTSSNCSIADYKTKGVAEKVRQTIVSSGKAKEFDDFCEKTYHNGLTEDGLNSALMYDTQNIYSALGIKKPVEHSKNILASMLNDSDSAFVRLDNNKEIKIVAQKANLFSAMFSGVPNVEMIKNAVAREGYTLRDLQQGMTLALDSEILASALNTTMDLSPVAEKAYLGKMDVKPLIGSAVTKELTKYGIEDKTRAFSNMITFVL